MAQQEIKGRAKYAAQDRAEFEQPDYMTKPVAHLVITKLVKDVVEVLPGPNTIGAAVDEHIKRCLERGEKLYSLEIDFPQD